MHRLFALFALMTVPSCGDATVQAAPADRGPTRADATAAAPAPIAEAGPAPVAPALDPARGGEIGLVFEAYLSPHQEGDEEENTPSTTPAMFRSTTPSMSRAQRDAAGHRAHGVVRFSNDLSRAFVDVKVAGVELGAINMFHIHCGKPGILGPILVDFSLATNLQEDLADGVLSIELTNEHIVRTAEHGHGVLAAFTAGCIIPSASLGSVKPSKVSTIAGMAQMALERELYFNLHTTGQTYFGDIRGQIHPVSAPR